MEFKHINQSYFGRERFTCVVCGEELENPTLSRCQVSCGIGDNACGEFVCDKASCEAEHQKVHKDERQVKMEFKHINQANFIHERGEAIEKINFLKGPYNTRGMIRDGYNEGFKACLRFIESEFWNPDLPDSVFKEIMEDVDRIDKENI